jgi:hypothetical protein
MSTISSTPGTSLYRSPIGNDVVAILNRARSRSVNRPDDRSLAEDDSDARIAISLRVSGHISHALEASMVFAMTMREMAVFAGKLNPSAPNTKQFSIEKQPNNMFVYPVSTSAPDITESLPTSKAAEKVIIPDKPAPLEEEDDDTLNPFNSTIDPSMYLTNPPTNTIDPSAIMHTSALEDKKPKEPHDEEPHDEEPHDEEPHDEEEPHEEEEPLKDQRLPECENFDPNTLDPHYLREVFVEYGSRVYGADSYNSLIAKMSLIPADKLTVTEISTRFGVYISHLYMTMDNLRYFAMDVKNDEHQVLNDRIRELEKQVLNEQKIVKRRDETITQLNQSNNSLAIENKKLAQVQARVDELTTANATLTESSKNLAKQLLAANETVETHAETIKNGTLRLSELERQLTEAKTAAAPNARLQSELEAANERIKNITEARDLLKKEYDDSRELARKAMTALNDDLEHLRPDHTSLPPARIPLDDGRQLLALHIESHRQRQEIAILTQRLINEQHVNMDGPAIMNALNVFTPPSIHRAPIPSTHTPMPDNYPPSFPALRQLPVFTPEPLKKDNAFAGLPTTLPADSLTRQPAPTITPPADSTRPTRPRQRLAPRTDKN